MPAMEVGGFKYICSIKNMFYCRGSSLYVIWFIITGRFFWQNAVVESRRWLVFCTAQLMLSVFKKELLKRIPVQEKPEGTEFTWPKVPGQSKWWHLLQCVICVCVYERTQIIGINYNIGKYKFFTHIECPWWRCETWEETQYSLFLFIGLIQILFPAPFLYLSLLVIS